MKDQLTRKCLYRGWWRLYVCVCMCVCLCMCLCVCEREREKEWVPVCLQTPKDTVCARVCVCVCVRALVNLSLICLDLYLRSGSNPPALGALRLNELFVQTFSPTFIPTSNETESNPTNKPRVLFLFSFHLWHPTFLSLCILVTASLSFSPLSLSLLSLSLSLCQALVSSGI